MRRSGRTCRSSIGLPSADGYDGGVLPLRTYYALSRAMLGEERARPDGVLASRLDALPESRWLDLLGVRWVLASRVKDLTRGAIAYDRAISVSLRPGQQLSLTALPAGEFTRLGIISTVDGALSRGEQAGTVRLVAGPTALGEIPLVVGQQTAPGAWKAEDAPTLERVQGWSVGPDDAADWIADVGFPRQAVTRIDIVNTSPGATLVVRALNLIDDQRQMAFPLTLDDSLVRTDLFDVKLYERRDALPRAYVAGAATVLDDEAAARRLADPAYSPRNDVVLAPSASAKADSGRGRWQSWRPGDHVRGERARAGAASSDRRARAVLGAVG